MKQQIKKHIIITIILIGITLSSIGMYQANMARNVSRIVFEAAHKHNWFWTDGWFELLMKLSKQSINNKTDRDLTHLTKSFQASMEMTQGFSLLRNADGDIQNQKIIENLVHIFEISENQAEQIVWITTKYSVIFGEIPLMIGCTDHGTMYSMEMIKLLSENKHWYKKKEDFKRIYKNMKDTEKLYSDLSYKISDKADNLYFLFYG